MITYNWRYKKWGTNFPCNMNDTEVLIPQAPKVIPEPIGEREQEDIHEQNETKFVTDGYRGKTEYTVFENSEGYICLDILYSDGSHIVTTPILDCKHLRAHLVCETGTRSPIVCIVSMNDYANKIILSGKNISANMLTMILIKKMLIFWLVIAKRS